MSEPKKLPNIRIVNRGGDPKNTDVFDLDTGEQILNIKRIEIDLSRQELEVKLTVLGSFEYEGPVTVVEEQS